MSTRVSADRHQVRSLWESQADRWINDILAQTMARVSAVRLKTAKASPSVTGSSVGTKDRREESNRHRGPEFSETPKWEGRGLPGIAGCSESTLSSDCTYHCYPASISALAWPPNPK